MARAHVFVCPVTRGLESVLVAELRRLGLQRVHEERGAVRFHGALRDGYVACLRSRIASRVLLRLDRFTCPDADALYEGVAALPWEEHLVRGRTFAVRFTGTSRTLRDTRFSALRVKDAVVDRLRARWGDRPDVDPRDPDVGLLVHLRDGAAAVHVDLGGGPLHRRTGDRDGAPAPLKETLAAGILALAGWDRAAREGRPFLDPMCGSGTLLVEAAAVAADRDPGLDRARWGFDGWAGHDAAAWRDVRRDSEARARASGEGPVMVGRDQDRRALDRARDAAARRGLGGRIRLEHGPMETVEPPGPEGVLVTNPPYGVRLGEDDEALATYAALGERLKGPFDGWTAWILSADPRHTRALRMSPTGRTDLFNGPLRVQLLRVPVGRR